MKTIEITLYKFDELSESAQQTAINKWKESNYQNGEGLFGFAEICSDYLTDLGFINPKVQYSLSYSQGDGLSFSADGYKYIKEVFEKRLGEHHKNMATYLASNVYLKIQGNTGHYTYASKSDIDLYLEVYGSNDTPLVDDLIEAVMDDITNEYLTACRVLERNGYEQIEFEDSDEYIRETLEVNEYDFTSEGEIY